MREDLHEENEVLHEVWLPLREASEALGISPRAVQLRAQGGKIKRERREGRVLFAVPVHEAVHEAVHEESAALHAESEAERVADTRPSDALIARLEAAMEINLLLRQELEERKQEMREQRLVHQEQIARRDTAESELRRLMLADKHELNTLREQVKLLAAPVEDTPQPPQEARTAPEAAGGDILTPMPETRRWWEFWK